MPSRPPVKPQTDPLIPLISEVRYSLPDLLREIDVERRESSFAMETLEQIEIRKMFSSHRRHARSRK